jgi:hypothetical protein
MKLGKILSLLISAAVTAIGLCAPMMAEKFAESKAISDSVAGLIGMLGIPIGLCAAVFFLAAMFM